jgi:L-threonine-O-3-phosphate decarboxylase
MRQPAHGGNLAWAAATAGCSPSAIVDFSASISPLGPPFSILSAIESQLGNIRHYPDPNYLELRKSLSHFHHLSSEWILPGNGSAELLTLAGRELAEFAATVLIAPAFGDYYRALNAYDAKVLEFPLSVSYKLPVFSCVLSGIFDKLQLIGKNGIIVNNPHNPTGILLSREDILPLLHDFALVVVDEAFMDFLPPEQEQSLIPLVSDYPNLVVLRSLTKFYSLPGLRLGYAVAHPERLRRWQSWRDPWSVNTLAEVAAIAALNDEEFQAQTWAWLAPEREKLFQGLSDIKGLRPFEGAANFLLVESEQSVTQLQEKLLKQHRILIRDCLSFPTLGDRFFRVAVRSESENQRLLDALANVQ